MKIFYAFLILLGIGLLIISVIWLSIVFDIFGGGAHIDKEEDVKLGDELQCIGGGNNPCQETSDCAKKCYPGTEAGAVPMCGPAWCCRPNPLTGKCNCGDCGCISTNTAVKCSEIVSPEKHNYIGKQTWFTKNKTMLEKNTTVGTFLDAMIQTMWCNSMRPPLLCNKMGGNCLNNIPINQKVTITGDWNFNLHNAQGLMCHFSFQSGQYQLWPPNIDDDYNQSLLGVMNCQLGVNIPIRWYVPPILVATETLHVTMGFSIRFQAALQDKDNILHVNNFYMGKPYILGIDYDLPGEITTIRDIAKFLDIININIHDIVEKAVLGALKVAVNQLNKAQGGFPLNTGLPGSIVGIMNKNNQQGFGNLFSCYDDVHNFGMVEYASTFDKIPTSPSCIQGCWLGADCGIMCGCISTTGNQPRSIDECVRNSFPMGIFGFLQAGNPARSGAAFISPAPKNNLGVGNYAVGNSPGIPNFMPGNIGTNMSINKLGPSHAESQTYTWFEILDKCE